MSVCNIFVGRDKVLCLTDSLVYRGDTPTGLCERKCFISSSGNYAFAVRGTIAFITRFVDTFTGFTHVDLVMPTILDLPERWGDRYFEASPGEVTIMHWSTQDDAPCAVRFFFQRGGTPVQRTALTPGVHLAPDIPGAKLPENADERVMMKIAIAQHKVKDMRNLAMCIGGVMHITSISRSGIFQKILCVYPDYSEHASRWYCPNADEVSHLLSSEPKAA